MRHLLTACICLFLFASCAAAHDNEGFEALQKIGTFQLDPVAPDSYWYDGTTYEYREYGIEIVSTPCAVRVLWNGTFVGNTPFRYSYTGSLERGEKVTVSAVPFDKTYRPQEYVLTVNRELPRKIVLELSPQP